VYLVLWTLLKTTAGPRQKYNSIHSISKIFLVFQNYFDSSDDISLFIILKLSALYIFFGFIFIDSRNVLRNLQRLPNKKNKKQREKTLAV
jgi:hypothetical protein